MSPDQQEQPEVSKSICLFHKEYGAVFFESVEETKDLDPKEWFDTPNFGAVEKPQPKFKPKKPFEKMTKIELLDACISVGIEKEKAVGLTKEQLIELLK